jgi:uncharacterized protein YjiS (DUF1127 family)
MEAVMQAIQAQSIALLQNCERKQSKIISILAMFFSAVEEGFKKAEQYEALARKSDSELAALGVTREDLARFVMIGKW